MRQAEPLLLQASKVKLSKDNIQTHFTALILLAGVLISQGKYAQADKIYQTALNDLSTTPDVFNHDSLESDILAQYIIFLLDQKNNAKAITLGDRLLEIFGSEQRRRNFNTNSLDHLARAFNSHDLYAQSDKFYKMLLDIQVLTDKTSPVMTGRVNLLNEWADVKQRRQQGQYLIPYVRQAIAEARSKKAISINEMQSLQNLLVRLESTGGKKLTPRQAHPEFETQRDDKLDMQLKAVGSQNIDEKSNPDARMGQLTATAYLQLQKNDLPAALLVLRRALDLYRSLPKVQNVASAMGLSAFGARIAEQNEQKGVEYWDELFSIALVKNDVDLIDRLLDDRDRYFHYVKQDQKSIPVYQTLVHQQEQRTGIGSVQTLRYIRRLKTVYQLQKLYLKSLDEQLKICSIEERVHDANLANDLFLLTQSYAEAKKYQEAIETYKRALSASKTSDPNHTSFDIIFTTLESLSGTYQSQNRDNDSDTVLVDALSLGIKYPTSTEHDRYAAMWASSKVDQYIGQKKYASAVFLVTKAISVLEGNKKRSVELLELRSKLACAYAYGNELPKSFAVFEKVHATIVKNTGANSPEAKGSVQQLANALRESKHEKDADNLLAKYKMSK